MFKHIIIAAVLMASISLTACNAPESGLPKYDTESISEDAVDKEINKAVQNTVERLASEKHVAPELSDDFCSKYLDMNSFEELKIRTLNGIKVTEASFDLSKNRAALWKQITDNANFNQYTTADLDRRIAELKGIVEELARNNKMSLEEYLSQVEFGLSMDEYEAFIKEQAEKYYQEYSEIDEQIKKATEENNGK